MKHEIISLINERMDELSKGQKRIAAFILSDYEKVAYMTASKLGNLVGVSESTVVRFATEMGYDGYPEMQNDLLDLVRTNLTTVQRLEVTNNLMGDADILEKVLNGDMEKIRRTLEGIDRGAFYDAIDRIMSAKNIYIIGVRSSSSLAGFMNYSFRMMFDNVKFIQTTSGSEMFEQIMRIGRGDVMVAISFPRYSKRIINAVEFANTHGADVIAITDSNESPIAKYANQLLTAKSDMVSFVDSLVAPLSIINALIVALSIKKQEELSVRLCELEQVWDKYDVYDKKN